MQLRRALLKQYGIIFLIKGRRKHGQDVPGGEGQWFAYDLSLFITGKWAVNSMRSEGSTFWVKFEHVPDMEEIALKHAREIITEAKRAGMEYSEAIGITTRAIETIKNKQEVTDATTPLLEQWMAPQTDPIAPALTNPVPIIGPSDDHPTPVDKAPTVPGTDANNEMSCSVDGMVPVADTDMGEANDDEAVAEKDAFDQAFPNAGDLVSLKMFFCIK